MIVKIKTSKSIKKMDVVENAPIIEVGSRKRFTSGYSRGVVKSQIPCKNGTTRFEFFPTDIEQGEYKARPPMQCVIVKNEFIKRLARGEDSSYREIVKCIDRFPTDIPEKLRDTIEGKEMSKEGQKAFLKATFGDWIKSGDDALHEAILGHTRVGMTKLALATIKEENETLRKLRPIDTETEKEKK